MGGFQAMARWLRRRVGLLISVPLCAAAASASAGDLAPTAAGADKLRSVLATYFGPNNATVALEGDHYAATLDVVKMLAPLAADGVKIEMAPVQLNLTEEIDGAWRVGCEGFPPMTVQFKDGDFSTRFDSYKFSGVVDPAISAFREGETSAEKGAFQLHSPDVDEIGAIGSLHWTGTGAAAAGGGLAATAHEDLGDVAVTITPKKKEGAAGPAPAPSAIRLTAGAADVKLDNLRIRQLLDLWAFFVVHQTRSDLAAHQEELKTKLRALLPVADKAEENFALQKLVVESARGPFILDSVKANIAADQFPSKGTNEFHLAFAGISPPPGIVPPALTPLLPTAIDVNVKYSGYDYGAGAAEAINDLDLSGEGPVIPEADRQKIASLMIAGPIIVTILPSHIVAPQLDLSFEGQLRLEGGQPVGKVTLTARDFDRTMTAAKNAGPLATPQVITALTMARGLAKADPDGSMTWVAEYSADGVVKLNGLPLGKAPAQ